MVENEKERELHELTTYLTEKSCRASDHVYDITVFTAKDHQLSKVAADLKAAEYMVKRCWEVLDELKEKYNVDDEDFEELVERRVERQKNSI